MGEGVREWICDHGRPLSLLPLVSSLLGLSLVDRFGDIWWYMPPTTSAGLDHLLCDPSALQTPRTLRHWRRHTEPEEVADTVGASLLWPHVLSVTLCSSGGSARRNPGRVGCAGIPWLGGMAGPTCTVMVSGV
mgnify:FL=1